MTTFLVKNSLIPQPTVVGRDAALAQLQDDVADLAKYQEKLTELQKQYVRDTLMGDVAQGIQELASLADSINALATQLEAKMLNFKKIAIETNRAYHAIQQPTELNAMDIERAKMHRYRPLSIWQIHYSYVPVVVKKKAGFVLTARIVDLFQAEKGDAQKRAEAAEHRRKVFERWLAKQRQFSEQLSTSE